jgi:acetyl-CoA carboxylase beta subunit
MKGELSEKDKALQNLRRQKDFTNNQREKNTVYTWQCHSCREIQFKTEINPSTSPFCLDCKKKLEVPMAQIEKIIEEGE